MKQKEFNRKLKMSLFFHFNPDEIQDVLSDYNEFFAAGLAEGKSEEQLCEQFGKPGNIALELMLENKKRPYMKIFSLKNILRILAGAILMFLSMTYILNYGDIINTAWNSFGVEIGSLLDLILPVYIFTLWFVMTGKIKNLPILHNQNGRCKNKTLLIFHSILPVTVIITCLLVNVLQQILNSQILHDGMIIVWIWRGLLLFPAITLLYSLFAFYRYTPKFFTLTCHSIAVIAFLYRIISLLRNISIDDGYNLIQYIPFYLKPYGIGAIITLAFFFYIFFLIRRESK